MEKYFTVLGRKNEKKNKMKSTELRKFRGKC